MENIYNNAQLLHAQISIQKVLFFSFFLQMVEHPMNLIFCAVL